MWRLAFHELRGQWRLSVLISAGLILAALAYVSLLGTASGTVAVLTGDIGRAWTTPYDLLVRPSGDLTQIERADKLVSPNFLSSLNGGITENQLNAIRRLPNVSVAAPLAVVGYVPLDYTFEVPDMTALVGKASFAVVKLGGTATGDDGLAHYPLTPEYFVLAPKGHVTATGSDSDSLSYGGKTIQCNESDVICEGATYSCAQCVDNAPYTYAPSSSITIPIPVLLAGIDPKAEAALEHLPNTIVKGSYLPSTEAPILPRPGSASRIPVLLSTQSFISEDITLRLSEAASPGSVLSGAAPATLSGWHSVYTTQHSVQSLYAEIARTPGVLPTDLPNVAIPGQLTFQSTSSRKLKPTTHRSDPSLLDNPNCLGCEQMDVPPEARDTWFRKLTVATRIASKWTYGFTVVGEYNPRLIPGFNSLAGGNLTAYAPPQAKLPSGANLLPTRNPAGYITSPPLMLTTLAGAQFFANYYSGGHGNAFISSIRVRVSGTGTPSQEAQARLVAVAEAIHQKTGLDVSLVKGSSALPVKVSLPAGKFGEPAMTITQYWGKEGAAIDFLNGLNTESIVLFLLTFGVVVILLGVIGQLAARRRRRDFALLRAVGWPLIKVVRLVLTEMLVLGLFVGVSIAVLALVLTRVLDPAIPVLPVLAVIPILAVMSVAAPTPALLAAAHSPSASALRRGTTTTRFRMRSVRSLVIKDLLGTWRLESALCVATCAIGAGLVGGVLLIVGGFAGTLGPTSLGRFLATQVGPLDIVMVVIAILAGVGTSAALLSLAYLERQVELSTLRAIGWSRATVSLVVAFQALALSLGGGGVAAVVLVATGLMLHAPGPIIIAAPLLALLVAALTATVAMSGTMSLAYHLRPAQALRVS